MVVKNLNGHAIPSCRCGSWLNHWRTYGRPSPAFVSRQRCSVVMCDNPIEAGGRVQKEVLEGMRTFGMVGDASWYIVPLCRQCLELRGATLTVDEGCGLAPARAEETCGLGPAGDPLGSNWHPSIDV